MGPTYWLFNFRFVFIVLFAIVFGIIVFSCARGISQWVRNNRSPRLTVAAKLTAKRRNVTHTNTPVGGDVTGAHGYYLHTDETYYFVFRAENGDTLEFVVPASEFDRFSEGDTGYLCFQGTRYLGFEK